MARQGRVFAGVEGDYLEFAFFDPGSLRLLGDTMRVTDAPR